MAINRGRPEARGRIRFEATAEQTCLPAAAQAARLTRSMDRAQANNGGLETEWRIRSRPPAARSAEAMSLADRRSWGIENGLHLRLDVTAGEDRRRVRRPTAALPLAMVRRATVSRAVHWISQCRHPRQATLQGFHGRPKRAQGLLPRIRLPSLLVTTVRNQRYGCRQRRSSAAP